MQNHRLTKRLLIHVAFAFGLASSFSGCKVVEHKLLYAPKPMRATKSELCCNEKSVTVQDVYFSAADGTKLHGWFVEPKNATGQQHVLFSHGRSGNIASTKEKLYEFVDRHRVSVFAYDYRGFGKSEGTPSERGIYQDARAARDWLVRHTDKTPNDIILMGRSLGSAVAIELASTDGAKALIVESGFTSIPAVFRHHTHNVLPGKRLKSRFDSEAKIQFYNGPIFISHGVHDKLIPFEHSVRLADAAVRARRVKFVEVDGDHHTQASEEYSVLLSEFLQAP